MKNSQCQSAASEFVQPKFKRRAIVLAITAVSALAVVGVHGTLLASAEVAGNAGVLANFVRLSEFATHRKLDPTLAGRYYQALKKRNPQFDIEIANALGSIDQAKPADIDAFLEQIDAPIKATVVTLVSAWYLGFVGSGQDVELISYAEALMYEPTRGILVVPSYGGGPNSWGEKPV